jgi:hypothetical protein
MWLLHTYLLVKTMETHDINTIVISHVYRYYMYASVEGGWVVKVIDIWQAYQ